MKNLNDYLNESLNEAYTDLKDLDDFDLFRVNFMEPTDSDPERHIWTTGYYKNFHNSDDELLIGIKKDIEKIIRNRQFADYVNSLPDLNDRFGTQVENLALYIEQAKYYSFCNNVSLKDAFENYYKYLEDDYFSSRIPSLRKAFDKMFELKLDRLIDKDYKINRDNLVDEFTGYGSRRDMLKRFGLLQKYLVKK